jgi:hypothetical protein
VHGHDVFYDLDDFDLPGAADTAIIDVPPEPPQTPTPLEPQMPKLKGTEDALYANGVHIELDAPRKIEGRPDRVGGYLVGPAYNGRRKFVTPDDRFDHPHWVAVDDREAHIKVLHAGDDRVTYGETAERALKMRAEDWIRVYGRYYETGIVNKGMGYTWFGAKESPMANFEIPMQADNPAAARYLTLSAQHRAHVEAAIANKQRGEISQLVRDEYTDLFPPKAAPCPRAGVGPALIRHGGSARDGHGEPPLHDETA